MGFFLKILKDRYFTSLNYNDLVTWEVGEAVIKEAVSHLEEVGFLDGLKDDVKGKIAVAFDNATYDMIHETDEMTKLIKRYNYNCYVPEEMEGKYNFDFTVILYALIRRVVAKVDNFDYKKLLDYLNKLSFLAINYDEYDVECDIEAEFTAILADTVISLFKRNKKDNETV